MKELLLCSPMIYSSLAQVTSDYSTFERLGFLGTSLLVTVFLWKYFTDRDAKNEADYRRVVQMEQERATAENNRLLADNNTKQDQIIDLLKQRVLDGKHVTIDNQDRNPVPTEDIKS